MSQPNFSLNYCLHPSISICGKVINIITHPSKYVPAPLL